MAKILQIIIVKIKEELSANARQKSYLLYPCFRMIRIPIANYLQKNDMTLLM